MSSGGKNVKKRKSKKRGGECERKERKWKE
jgi:hypothetical protein